jgi:nucleoside phosphorylase
MSPTKGDAKNIKLEDDEPMNNKIDYILENEVENLKGKLNIVIMTATDIEKEAVFKYLKPLPDSQSLKVDTTSKQTYTIGVFGEYPIIHVQTNMGSSAPDGSTLTTKDVLDYWKPKALIMPGIAFGKDSKKQKIGYVLISESIIQYDSSKIKEGNEIPRGVIARSGLILFDRFRNCFGWEHKLEDGSKVEKFTGKILSGSKLVDDKKFKEHLFTLFPEAIGGEMEGSGIYAASFHESFDQWILVKGICDWAENKESGDKEKNQIIAAEAAVSLCYHVMSNPNAFKYLEVKSIKDIDFKETNNKVNKEFSESKNTTIFNGTIYGPINTGSGDMNNK